MGEFAVDDVERFARALFTEFERQFPPFTRRCPDDLDEATGVMARFREAAKAALRVLCTEPAP